MRLHVAHARRRLASASAVLALAAGGLVALAARDVQPPAGPAGMVAPPSAPTSVQNQDGIPVLGWDAGAVRTPSASGAWGGPRTGSESTLSDRVASYELRAVVDPAKHT